MQRDISNFKYHYAVNCVQIEILAWTAFDLYSAVVRVNSSPNSLCVNQQRIYNCALPPHPRCSFHPLVGRHLETMRFRWRHHVHGTAYQPMSEMHCLFWTPAASKDVTVRAIIWLFRNICNVFALICVKCPCNTFVWSVTIILSLIHISEPTRPY